MTGPVLILGATSDIARALAHAFAARGHSLQLAARTPERLADDAADLRLRHGVAVTTHHYDASVPDPAALFDRLPAVPRIVVSAVGLLGDQARDAAEPARARAVIEANFTGPALALSEAARRLRALDGPTAVIGISSVAGDRGRAKNYVYGAAKAGFTAWLSGLRQDCARTDLHVMTVKPGFVATRMTEGMDLPAPLTETPEAVAALILRALDRRRHVVYTPKWRLVMTVLGLIPEPIFKKLRF